MMDFKRVKLEDAADIRRYIARTPSKQLVNCFEAFYLWRDVYNITFAEIGGALVFKLEDEGEDVFFFPFGDYDLGRVVGALKEYCLGKSRPLKFVKVPADKVSELEGLYPGSVQIEPERDNFEYIYTADTFRYYKGAALQSKRNFVNYARKNYDWSYEPVSSGNLDQCRAFAERFEGDDSFNSDNAVLFSAIEDFGDLSLRGGLLRVDRDVEALFMVSPLEDRQTAAGLFLRGNHDMKGVIPTLYQQFFLDNPQFGFVNLAEDLGLEGLRKNKLSYMPSEIMELSGVAFIG